MTSINNKILILSIFISGFLFVNFSLAVEPTIEIDPSKNLAPLCAWTIYDSHRYDGSQNYCYNKSGQCIETALDGSLCIFKFGGVPATGINPEYCYLQQDRIIPVPPGNRGTFYCPPIDKMIKFSVSADRVSEQGKFTVNWDAPSAIDCALSGNEPETGKFKKEFDGVKEWIRGSKTYDYVKRGIYSFKFECNGYNDNTKSLAQAIVSRSLTVFVGDIPPAPTIDFKITPPVINKGEKAKITWKAQNIVSLSMNQGIGSVTPEGSIEVSPGLTTRYTITGAGEFAELGLARHSITLTVIVPRAEEPKEEEIVIPPDQPVEIPEEAKALKTDLKINNSDGPLTMSAPATFNLSWNLDKYCLAYGSWLGIKTKLGTEMRTEKKAGTYTYKLNCPGYGADEVIVKVIGGTGVGQLLPKAEASISTDGKNFSNSTRIIRGKETEVWLSAAYDINNDKLVSRDSSGSWTNLMSQNGRCEWNSDLNQGNPIFESVTLNPETADDCAFYLGKLKFFDKAGVYRYGILRLVQNDGKVSNTGYINVVIEEPPMPKGPPVIKLKINNVEKDTVLLAAPAEYNLSWDAGESDSCAASGSWAGDKFPSGSEHFVSSQKKDFTYNLNCANRLGTTDKSILLKVTELPVCDFGALPLVINKTSVLNRQSVLSWKCQFANTCSISPSADIKGATYGSVRVTPAMTTKYVLTCKNLEGTSSFDQLVEVK